MRPLDLAIEHLSQAAIIGWHQARIAKRNEIVWAAWWTRVSQAIAQADGTPRNAPQWAEYLNKCGLTNSHGRAWTRYSAANAIKRHAPEKRLPPHKAMKAAVDSARPRLAAEAQERALIMIRLRDAGLTFPQIAAVLTRLQIPARTKTKRQWRAANIQFIVSRYERRINTNG